MSVYVDFCFTVGEHHAVVIGWGLRGAVTTAVELVDGGSIPLASEAAHLSLHRRTDLVDAQAVGFVLIFSLAAPVSDAPAVWTLHAEGLEVPVAAHCTGTALDRFVARAGEEAFYSVLSAIADGRLPPLAPRAAALVHDRVRRQAPGLAERPGFAAAFDEAIIDPESGRAMVSGWALFAEDERPASAALVSVGPASIRAMALAFGVIERPDLIGFRGRYPLGARPGFVGTVAGQAGASAGNALLILTRGLTVGTAIASFKMVDAPMLFGRFDDLTSRVGGEARKRLRRRLSEGQAATIDAQAVPAASPFDPRPVLALEHDGRTRHLRDVLGRVAELGWHDFDLALPGRVTDREVESALAGAQRDTPGLSVRFLEGSHAALAAAAAECRPFIYLRSSILMQSDAAEWLADVASGGPPVRLIVFAAGSRPNLAGSPAEIAVSIAAKGLPFAAALRGGTDAAELLSSGTKFLTIEGLMLGAIGRLSEEMVDVRVVDADLHLGRDEAADRLFGVRSLRDFDRESIAVGD